MKGTMLAMRMHGPGQPLRLERVACPRPGPGEVLLQVLACGVCRTDLHVRDGELPCPRLPLTLGHEIVARVLECGAGVTALQPGQRAGVPWLARTCGVCRYCRSGAENLCESAEFTGYTRDGGYAQYALADARYCLSLPERYSDVEAAPLLCAGLIGYRAYRAAGEAECLGLYGFGAAAHLLAQLARADGRRVFAFTRAGDVAGQAFARSLGAEWAGAADESAPEPLDAAILFAPAGELVPRALAATRKGGRVVCAGIHMSDIPAFPYRLLWQERSVSSVANLTRSDGARFMQCAARTHLHCVTEPFALDEANTALERLRRGQLRGAAVLSLG
ncbi:MAG: zinc-dependent alcohol dehydrogenase family protein [Gammaproteobacteria bacterium]|nr:zinc-dependent alcohol dehydrogenase family protein [Gammaproteobacteria bacterium]MBV9621737.1 zinc-dependent alcohol dehydrogenase family protein [Gammaproteobacteria bacterium]